MAQSPAAHCAHFCGYVVHVGATGAVTWSEELHSSILSLRAALHFFRPLATQVVPAVTLGSVVACAGCFIVSQSWCE